MVLIVKKKSKKEYPIAIQKLFKLAQYKDFPIKVHGSASRSDEKYFSDYDIYSDIDKKQKIEDVYKGISAIIKKIDSSKNYYLNEIKLQTNKDKKIRFYPNDDLTLEDFKKIEDSLRLIKIDFIIWDGKKFIIADIAYTFDTPDNKDSKNNKNKLKKELKNRLNKGEYYKALRRLASYDAIINNTEQYNKIHDFLNQPIGKLYVKKSNLEAIKNVKENYDTGFTHKRIVKNLSDLGYKSDIDLNKEIEQLNKELNSKAKEFLDTLELP